MLVGNDNKRRRPWFGALASIRLSKLSYEYFSYTLYASYGKRVLLLSELTISEIEQMDKEVYAIINALQLPVNLKFML
ncbi:hypothetical protein M0802_005912 [Mischocyttarus mexicanus]|nr:hypothetical protein M0802_005912 [Mischocyttarus mexicanus]